MRNVYLYVTDTMADWEIGHISAELHSRRFFRRNAPEIVFRTTALSAEPVRSMGGLTITPDCVFEPSMLADDDVLILPGSDTWQDAKHVPVIGAARDLLARGGTVCAICGATLALAFGGMLDDRRHTSNGAGFLDMFCPAYKGKDMFSDEPAVADGNLITAGATGGVMWTSLILKNLDVFSDRALAAWTRYFSYGKAEDFFALMGAVQQG